MFVFVIGLQAQEPKEFTYNWIVVQYKEHQSIKKIPNIKNHLSLYTKLVKNDLRFAQKSLNKKLAYVAKLVVGGYLTVAGLKHIYFVLHSRYNSLGLSLFAAIKTLLGVYICQNTLDEQGLTKERIALDEALLAELYALSIS